MLLPVAVLSPLLLAWLFAVGTQVGLYGTEFQVGLVMLVTGLLWSAARVDRIRFAGVEALRRSEERYRNLVERLPAARVDGASLARHNGRERDQCWNRRSWDRASADVRRAELE
jgi:hypothetical protein